MIVDPETWRLILHPDNGILHQDPTEDNRILDLFDQGSQEQDPEARAEIYREWVKVITDQSHFITLYHPHWIHSYENHVKNHDVHPLKSEFHLRNIWLDE